MNNSKDMEMAEQSNKIMTHSRSAQLQRQTTADTLHTTHTPNTSTNIKTSDKIALNFIQINLHGSSRATVILAGYMAATDIHIALIQDNHQHKKTGQITGFNKDHWNITKMKRNKSAIITRLGTKPITTIEKDYTTAIILENDKKNENHKHIRPTVIAGLLHHTG